MKPMKFMNWQPNIHRTQLHYLHELIFSNINLLWLKFIYSLLLSDTLQTFFHLQCDDYTIVAPVCKKRFT